MLAVTHSFEYPCFGQPKLGFLLFIPLSPFFSPIPCIVIKELLFGIIHGCPLLLTTQNARLSPGGHATAR